MKPTQREKRTLSTGKPRVRWPIGPATGIGLILAAFFFCWQQAQSREPDAGHLYYEADAAGHMHAVSAPTPALLPTAPLWKPEVALLLKVRQKLGLTDQQYKQLQRLNTAWLEEKADWNRQFGQSTQDATGLLEGAKTDRSASLRLVSAHLADYSRLSRLYDQRRSDYWQRATSVLSPMQQAQLARLRPQGRG